MVRSRTLAAWAASLILAANLTGMARGQVATDAPASITPAAVRQVKQATVMLKVTSEGGRNAEGSGFFAVEPGVIVTNVHVLGMLQANSKPPTQVEVIVHGGAANEMKLPGKVLGVDRASDIAVLRVEGQLPAPLQFGSTDDLVETQHVYIFGFPFGSELGKNLTVSESSVSSLRTGAHGVLEQIQVNGGMHPGNSGGPVVNAKGQVVGVSVAVIRNTQINFAIPAPKVSSLLDGCIVDTKAGMLFRDQSDVRVPLQYHCLDPLKHIREIRVEVWAGNPALNRAFSSKERQSQPGDGPRQTYLLKVVKHDSAGEVLLPKLQPGQVAWAQPMVVLAKGGPVWGAPRAFDAALAVERVGADLNSKLTEQKVRTVQLKTAQSVTLGRGNNKFVIAQSAELPVLESFSLHPKGALVEVAFGLPRLSLEEDGKKARQPTEVPGLVQRIPPRFVIDQTNKLRERADVSLNPRLAPTLREQVGDYLNEICNAYEAANFIIPNRGMKPRETWPVRAPLLLKGGGKPEIVDLVMTCTFEGIRTASDQSEAVVTFEGNVQGRAASKDKVDGLVAGQFSFDTKHGFISKAKMSISSEASSPGGELQLLFAFDIDLTRVEGNPNNLSLPKATTPPPSIANRGVRNPAAPSRRNGPGANRNGPGASRNMPGATRNEAPGTAPFKASFKKPEPSKEPTSYLKVVSQPGDYIGQGKTYEYPFDKLDVQVTQRGLSIRVDGWSLQVSAPANQSLSTGEFTDAKRNAFNGDSPGLDFSGKGRGSNTLKGAFVVWELEVSDNKVVKLAIDFEQHSEGRPAGLTGKLRLNSTLE